MNDRFGQLLSDLSPFLGLSLHPDKIGACSIAFTPHQKIQLQLDVMQDNLLLFSKVIEIPPGKFRENVLKESLKANGAADPLPAILAYFHATNHLVIYQSYPLSILNGERLAAFIGAFLQVGENWYNAINRGLPSPAR